MAEPPQLFRRAVPADADGVRGLVRIPYGKWVPLSGREPLPMSADYRRAIAERIVDLWEEDGQLLALIELVPAEHHLLIENIAVRPDQQGKGFGERLLAHAEAMARSMSLGA